MSNPVEGRIEIGVLRHADRPPQVSLRSSRPQLAQKLLAGQAPERAAQLVGMLFSLCGQAQRTAAELAAGAAKGVPASESSGPRVQRVLAELAREHAWRLLLDWPRQAGLAEQAGPLRRLHQAGPEAQSAELDNLLAETLLGEPAADWLGRMSGRDTLAQFDAWRAAGATQTARLFAALPERDLDCGAQILLPALADIDPGAVLEIGNLALADPAFCTRPRLAGEHAETGALGRSLEREPLLLAWCAARGRGPGVRMLARLLELARLPERLAGGGQVVAAAWSPAPDTGVAAVETSRGLLVHALRLADGRVAQYRIVAPTEWNFQPGGPLESAIRALPPTALDEAGVRRVALAMDPCVEYAVEVADA